MANFKGHLVGAIAAYFLIAFVFGLTHVSFMRNMQWLAATMAGALFPDIDVYSKGQRLFLKVLFLLMLICLVMKAFMPLLFVLALAILPVVMPHRGIFHDLYFIIILCLVSVLCLVYVMPQAAKIIVSSALFFMLGVISHLLLDKGFKKTIKTK